VLLSFAFLISCKDHPSALLPYAKSVSRATPTAKEGPKMSNANTNVPVLVVPLKSMGQVTIGQDVSSLSVAKKDNGSVEVAPGISALIENGKVVDIWIDDLRKLNTAVNVSGVIVSPQATISDIKSALGPCAAVPVKGGQFFNCDSGLSIGTDFAGEGVFVQLRVKPR
jgi:hypothetical protein